MSIRAACSRACSSESRLLDRDVHEAGIAEPPHLVLERQLERLDLEMERLRRSRPVLLEIELLEDVEREQHEDALRHQRLLVYGVAAIVGREGTQLLGLVPFEIVQREQPAVTLGVVDELPCQLAAIEVVDPVLGDALQGRREQRLPPDASDVRHLAAGQEHRRAVRILPVGRRIDREHVVQSRRHRDAFAGVRDRRFEQLCQRHRAVRRVRVTPARQRSGDGRGEQPVLRDAADLAIVIERGAFRRRAAAVERDHPVLARIVEQHEGVGAEVPVARLDQHQHGRARDRRVHRVAATLQHIDGGLADELVDGRHHPAGAHGEVTRRAGLLLNLALQIAGHHLLAGAAHMPFLS